MHFDHQLNLVSMVLPTDQPYADAIVAAGYSLFPHYCAMVGPHLRTFAFAVFHVEHTMRCFLVAGHRPLHAPPHCGGVPLLYAGDDPPATLVTRLQALCPHLY